MFGGKGVLLVLAIAVTAVSAQAAAPARIPLQGRLSDATGTP
jgi:hypothetical protein